MTIEEAKAIDLRDFLSAIDCKAVKVRGHNHWYRSPFREEHNASFKVNAERNEWFDFGIGKGGNIIELGKFLYHTSYIPDILRNIETHTTNLSNEKKVPCKQVSVEDKSRSDIQILPLSHPALLYYIRGRGVNVDVAKAYCKEVHYKVRDRSYFGIAFLNRSGGMEIRNPFFKGCEGRKDISIVHSVLGRTAYHCCVFEGFFNFLSYATSQTRRIDCLCIPEDCDYIILNSVSNISKAAALVKQYKHIHCYLDNDEAGRKATQALVKNCPDTAIDESFRYMGYNDLNDYISALSGK